MFKLSFKQQVLTGFSVSLAFVLVSAATSYFSIKSLSEDARWTNHTYDVINLIQKIENLSVSSETAVRGYALSEQKKFLEPYTANATKIGPTIRELRKLVLDNPEQSKSVDSLEYYANEKLADMRSILESNASRGRTAGLEQILTGNGQRIKDKMLRISNKITKTEHLLLEKRKADTDKSNTRTIWIVLLSAVIIFGLILFLFSYIKRTFDQQKLTEEQMRDSNIRLEKISADNKQKNWLLTGVTEVTESMRGEQEIEELSANVVSRICNYTGASVGALFLLDEKRKTFVFKGGYAYQRTKSASREYSFGEGMIGQAAIEKKSKMLDNIPEDYLKISSALGDTAPSFIFILPIVFENMTIAVIELGLTEKPNESKLLFLNTITESIGVSINSAIARVKLSALFEQTQQQAEELESQQEELRTTNEELIYKSEQLQASEEELRVQQEELRQTNAELEEKAQQLEERNVLVNQAREAMSLKAEELELSSKYKSEFLANMSHELRTPLNSILILARILKENKPENLNEEQIKYAGVIHNAGTDLLTLINDILDLSKIESGKIDLTIEEVKPQSIKQDMEALFTELAKSKKIRFDVLLGHDLPGIILTDRSRLEQVIKNLLSNSFKFTPEHGQITFSITQAHKGHRFYSDRLNGTPQKVLALAVKDSGIGIPEDKQRLIFEAFQQADGSTSRKYGGTGLGLSISKELASILGGEIQVQSEVNSGSTFTLFIPEQHTANASQIAGYVSEENPQEPKIAPLIPNAATTPIKTHRLQTLLIVEDDQAFAGILSDYASEKGFKPILAYSGDKALELATSQLPDAIVLDIMLPVMDGWTILKKLKSDVRTRHIPVHMMSAGTVKESDAKQRGAIGFLKKPIEKDQLDKAFDQLSSAHTKYNLNKVLVIEDQELQSKILTRQLTDKGVEVKQAFTGNEALELLKTHIFDCIILDLRLPDISGFDLLDEIKSQPEHSHIPVIINTAMELDDDKMAHIMKHTEAMVLKSNKSNDRLIDEVSLFMNKLKQDERPVSRTIAKGKSVSTLEKALKGKTVLITDDDMRNIFALSSALQEYEMNIYIANNGKEAIQKLHENPGIDLVLMDIMMPEMDGYEAMRTIREEKKFAKLPIIALTAKAMKNDREKCIEAGANDYISKPVDMDKLLSMLRVWLS
ncbi:hybrid sensor histidine kinase/response regulator [Pedobacter ginsengisoli]|uniref:hybrid sensor histidine kinase/response regulator n=1 Tax=Pedobacter ginsengisoli TaxID=363852 RepID=UPI00254AFB9F|nr:response regulator [Pedobacter ginsengisoli]